MRLGLSDHKVLRAFVDRRAAEGHKLSTNGQRLDGHWLGGSRIAEWSRGEIVFHDLGSRAAQSVQRALRRHAAPNQLAETRQRVRARVTRDPSRPRRTSTTRRSRSSRR